MLKLFRRLEPGVNPDLEIGRFLTEKSRFDRIPARPARRIPAVRHRAPMTLAILQELVAHQGGRLGPYAGGIGACYFERAADIAEENRARD